MDNNTKRYTTRASYEAKVVRLIEMLKADERRSIDELAALFEVSTRMVYNMIDEVRQRGYKVKSNKGVPRLSMFVDSVVGADEVYLSAGEADLLLYLIHHLSAANPQRQSLTSRLGKDVKQLLQPYFCHVDEDLHKVSCIAEAMRTKRQLLIKGYRSGHSGTVADRLVEPVEWSANYRHLHAYDVDKRAMRTFVVSRMDGAEVTGRVQQFQRDHLVPEIDCFWMSGEPSWVTLRMSLLALNLLHEEYPLSRQYEVRDSGDASMPYEVTLEVRSPLGLSRFVKGLPEHVAIVAGDR